MAGHNRENVIQLWSTFFFREFGRVNAVAIMALNKEQVLVICERRDGDKKFFDKALIFVPIVDVNLSSRFFLSDDQDRLTVCRLAELLYGPCHMALVFDPLPGGKADIAPAPRGSALDKIISLLVATMDDKKFTIANRFFVPALLRPPLRR